MRVLNSADYGVPQKRERVILIGSLEKYSIKFPSPIYREKNKVGFIDLFKDNHPKWITVKEAIDDLKNIPENTDINHIFTKCGTEFIEKIKKTPIGKSVYGGFSDAYFRCYPNEPSKTVKENHGGVFIHYEKDRFMTPRELARLQSFEDSFLFEGTKSQILVQIGNAVPPKLSFAIAETLLKEF
jgi:DNA (cytosine-5)-methyltransferase 1